ncbi:hypothetical protein IMG5_165360 [Ichthyophthirius multifiliis]|uniref:Uncharacterized protein n=1 Tax=Ichthyophthirius multifiliis TaxID=5932 RepID=G0R0K6_ICHMU|nr:hypothetical protein IMG5_165360 [Ichthyophthirius multifiliis]EGR28992.1 hypothetical protein IMG5_165360 [Ichthyophthirius multifiliis]|eukprot:XP_004030228.1 hypothetical protein IMG5_165360 [Ichthyophthirius multifiliis]
MIYYGLCIQTFVFLFFFNQYLQEIHKIMEITSIVLYLLFVVLFLYYPFFFCIQLSKKSTQNKFVPKIIISNIFLQFYI